jgi:hypothetical protein
MKKVLSILILLYLCSCDRYSVENKVGTIQEIKYNRDLYYNDSLVLNNIHGVLSYGFFNYLNQPDQSDFYITFEYCKSPFEFKYPYLSKNGILLDNCSLKLNDKKYNLEYIEVNNNSILYIIKLNQQEFLNNNKFTFIYNNKEIECNYINNISNFSSLDTLFSNSKTLQWDKIEDYENEYFIKYDYLLRYTKDNKDYSLSDVKDKFVSDNKIELLDNISFSEFKDAIHLKTNYVILNLFAKKYFIYSKYESIFINNTNRLYFYYPNK